MSITNLNAPPAVHLGIIGMGYTGRQQRRAAAVVPAVRVVAVADELIAPPEAEGDPLPWHSNWRRLLADENVHAVSVCLPHHLHAEVAIAALLAGKHVLVEKPLATSAAEARRIVAAAQVSGKVLMVEMTHRFYPPVLAGRDLVRAGRLGQIFAVEDRIVEPVTPVRLPRWMFERRHSGGGVALTNGVHMLDRVAFVCGQPLRFQAGRAGWSQKLGDVEDTAAMVLSLADSTPVNLLASWPRGTGGMDDEMTVYGTLGTLRIWSWRGWRFEPADGMAAEHGSYDPGEDLFARVRVGMAGALREFAAAVQEGRPPDPTPADVLAAEEIIEAFYQQIP